MIKLCIVGNKEHGKDTAAEFASKNFHLRFKSSSVAALEIFLFDILQRRHGYKTIKEAFEDRRSPEHRAEWYTEICNYNKEDRTRLARAIMDGTENSDENDIYVGMRDRDELIACKYAGIFDAVIWIEDPRKPLESSASFNIDRTLADYVVLNDGTLSELEEKIVKVIKSAIAAKLIKTIDIGI